LYGPLLYFWCTKRLHLSPHDARDVVQEASRAISTAIDSYDRQRGGFRGWLWTIVLNKARDHLRKEARREQPAGGTERALFLADVPDDISEIELDAEDRAEENRLLHRALEIVRPQVQPQTWQAFWLITCEGRTATEAATELNMTPTAARVAKSRVLHRLRRVLGDLSDDSDDIKEDPGSGGAEKSGGDSACV
jgi:RNA polymerase sigma-70 factor (ECF subfamily)